MNWLFRPSTLVLVSAALALSAAALMFWPQALDAGKTLPLHVQDGDQEIAWLYAATNSATWERFVKAVETAQRRLQAADPAVALEFNESRAFPLQTTAVPELVLGIKGKRGRLHVRWYKLTSDHKQQDWVGALLSRRPVPLAIIGGSSSELAINLAGFLKMEAARQQLAAEAPLLLLANATVDTVPEAQGSAEQALNSVYADQTYRFCFTNRQMAEAVTDFIWSQSDLRPDSDPLYLTYWQDDPYSRDLNRRFLDALRTPVSQAAARDWAALAGVAVAGGLPLNTGNLWSQFRLATPVSMPILYSVGAFERPNRWEVEAARYLMETKLNGYPAQRRPLLVVPAASQPVRRFLRALVRFAPTEARRFVIATGDSITFNTIYRDRDLYWPIQDLPFPLVFFCHRNPMDESAGFVREGGDPPMEPTPAGASNTGTEDLLLFGDFFEALALAGYRADGLVANAAEFKRRLQQLHWSPTTEHLAFGGDGPLLFDGDGNRTSGSGEHVVCLRPRIVGDEVLPQAQIEVWPWQRGYSMQERWARMRTLDVEYEGASNEDPEPPARPGSVVSGRN